MGPKAKGKDKNKGKPEIPSIDPKEVVTELDKEFLEFQLSEIEKKLRRIEAREEELRTGTVELEEKIEEYKKEKGILISEQEQVLALKEEEKIRKREEAVVLTKEFKTRGETHLKHMEELEEKYNEMVRELSEEVEKLEEEVRILDDYKTNKDLYGEQLLELEREMQQQEMQHQRNLFYIEQKAELAKQRVKKELQSKLLQLSIEFLQTTQKRIGKPSHRMTQENKAIENELRLMKDDVLEYQEKYVKAKENVQLCKEHHQRWLSEKDKGIAKIVIQMALIKALMKDRLRLLKKHKEYFPFEVQNKTLMRKLKIVTHEIEDVMNEIKEVNEKIEKITEETEEMNEASSHLKKSTRRLNVHVRNALKIAEEARAVPLIPLGGLEEERYITTEAKIRLFKKRRDSTFRRKGKILLYLFEFLMQGQLTEDDKKFLKKSTASFDIDTISFTQIFKKPGEKEGKEGSLVESEEEAGPYVGEGSELSLPRSITPKAKSAEKERSESFEGEFEEEFGEGDEGSEMKEPDMERVEVIEFEEDLEEDVDGEEENEGGELENLEN